MKNKKLKGNMIMLLTSIIWGMSFIAQSKGVEAISPVAFNGIRCLLGTLVLIPVIFIIDAGKKKKGLPVGKFDKNLITGGVICGIFLCIATTLQTAGMVYTSPGKSGFLTALYMVIVPIVGLFMGKRIRPVIGLSVLLALGGLYLMCIGETFTVNKGDVLTIICAVVFAGHILVIDYYSPKVDGVKLSCMQFFVCGMINAVWMFIEGAPTFKAVFSCAPSIAYSGIMSCGVAYTLQIIGQKYTDPASASILMSLESVFATLSTVVLIALGWELTGGMLTYKEIFGCVLMFAAILLVQLPEKNKNNI